MDKTEYRLKLEEMTKRVEEQDFANALQIAKSIDWRRVKSIRTLNMVADIYEVNRDYRGCKDILLLAYDRATIGKSILYRLTEISLKLGEVDDAVDFYTEYTEVAPNDNSRYILKYKIYKARRSPLADQIAILEEYKDREYTERWAYELAVLYNRAGDTQKAIETCDDLILWFSEGKYVLKAMELKMKYQPLSPSQKSLYEQEKLLYGRQEKRRTGSISVPGVKAPAGTAPAADISGNIPQTGAVKTPVSEYGRPEAGAASTAAFGAVGSETSDFAGSGSSARKNWAEERIQPRREEKVDSRAVLKKMERAGAAITKDVSADDAMEEAAATDVSMDDYSVTSHEFMGKTANLKEQLAKSIHDVFSGIRKTAPQVEDLKVAEEEAAQSAPEEDIGNIKVQELEPERVEAEVKPHPEAAKTIMSRPEEPEQEEQIKGQMSFADFDLDALLKETASSLSEGIAAGDFREKADAAAAGVRSRETEDIAPEEAEPQEQAEPAAAAEETEDSEAAEAVSDADTAEEAVSGEAAPEEAVASEAEEVISEEKSEEKSEEEVFVAAEEIAAQAAGGENETAEETPAPGKPLYNEELEIPDPEPTPEERAQRTIPLNKIGQNTVPISIEEVLREETPEERRIRILNDAKPTRMSDEQRKIFTYFARIPGMDRQILEAVGHVYEHAGEHTSRRGNIAVMGAEGTGKTRLTHGLIVAMCQDLGLDAAKTARIKGSAMNGKDPAKIVAKMSGGFLVIENAGAMNQETVDKLNRAMEFRTDCMVLIIEDEKTNMRALLKQYPQFAEKFDTVISIPVFTNDELVTFARTYATENGCKMDEMGVLALYTLIGNNQSEEEPVTISRVKEMVDHAIAHARKGGRRRGKRGSGRDRNREKWTVLYEKDFEA